MHSTLVAKFSGDAPEATILGYHSLIAGEWNCISHSARIVLRRFHLQPDRKLEK